MGQNFVIRIYGFPTSAINNKINKRSGYVYLLYCPWNGLYKIGRSKNTPLRHCELEKQSPVDISLIHSFYSDDAPNAEKILQDRNVSKRIKGEWFKLDANEIDEIVSLQDGEL